MRLYVHLDTGNVSKTSFENVHVQGYELKRGVHQVELAFCRGGVVELLPVGVMVELGIKDDGDYDGEFLAYVTDFTRPGDATGFYTAELDADTAGVRALLGVDGTEGNDKPSAPAMLEVARRATALAEPEPSATVDLTLTNRLINGDEGVPEEGDPPYPPVSQLLTVLGNMVTAAIPEGQDYVEVDISGLELEEEPTHVAATVRKAAAAGENLFVGGVVVDGTESVRVEFQTDAPAGCQVTVLVA